MFFFYVYPIELNYNIVKKKFLYSSIQVKLLRW